MATLAYRSASTPIVLFILGMTDRLAELADVRSDEVGLQLEEENLPKRIRGSRKQKPAKGK